MRKVKIISYILLLCLLFSLAVLPSSAAAKEARDIIADPEGRVVAVSHRGDTVQFPANSLEAIEAAFLQGADAVSVAANKTSDGKFVLCEDVTLSSVCETTAASLSDITFEELKTCRLYDCFGRPADVYPVSLGEALESLGGSIYLILDVKYEDIGDVCGILEEHGAYSYVSLRCKVKSSEIKKLSSYGADIIGVYTGNIIWNSIGHINKLSEAGMMMAEYRTKNYFNVCYGSLVGNRFSADGNARAVAAAFEPDLCGKRTDDTNGWNELIKNGFTVIETNNIKGLVAYIASSESVRESLADFVSEAKKEDFSAYSEVSRKNIASALSFAEEALEGRRKSLAEYENAYSSLAQSLNSKMIADGKEEAKGALNITAGKLIAAILIGAAFIAVQIFIESLKKEKNTETEENKDGNKTESMDNKS